MSMFCTMPLFKLMGTGFASQMLPFLVQGLLDNVFLALAIAWEQFQQLSHEERRPGGLTRSVAAELRYNVCLSNTLAKPVASPFGITN